MKYHVLSQQIRGLWNTIFDSNQEMENDFRILNVHLFRSIRFFFRQLSWFRKLFKLLSSQFLHFLLLFLSFPLFLLNSKIFNFLIKWRGERIRLVTIGSNGKHQFWRRIYIFLPLLPQLQLLSPPVKEYLWWRDDSFY